MKLTNMAKPAKVFPIILWGAVVVLELIVLLVSTLTIHTGLFGKLSFTLQVLLVTILIQIIGFLLFIPHWLILGIAFTVLKKKRNSPQFFLQVACISNLVMLVLGMVLSFWCKLNYACSSEGSLANGGAVILLFILCQIFCTLPFLFGLNKLLSRKKKAESSISKSL